MAVAEVERLKKLLDKLEREYYENCDGIGWDGNERMQDYCFWICDMIEKLEKRIETLEKERDGRG